MLKCASRMLPDTDIPQTQEIGPANSGSKVGGRRGSLRCAQAVDGHGAVVVRGLGDRAQASPRVPQRSRAGIGLSAIGELPVEARAERQPFTKRSSKPADASAESLIGRAPLTMKLAPGSDWKATVRLASLFQSCAHAARACNEINAISDHGMRWSKRAPNSPRVAFRSRPL